MSKKSDGLEKSASMTPLEDELEAKLYTID